MGMPMEGEGVVGVGSVRGGHLGHTGSQLQGHEAGLVVRRLLPRGHATRDAGSFRTGTLESRR